MYCYIKELSLDQFLTVQRLIYRNLLVTVYWAALSKALDCVQKPSQVTGTVERLIKKPEKTNVFTNSTVGRSHELPKILP